MDQIQFKQLNTLELASQKPDFQSDYNIYISLTSIPIRFLHEDFFKVIDALLQQTLPVTKLFISFPHEFMRKFEVDEVKVQERINRILTLHQNVEVLRTLDYGPSTKLLGLLSHNKLNDFLEVNDLIIVVDDDMTYTPNLTLTHYLTFKMYNGDISAINASKMLKNFFPYVHHKNFVLNYSNYDNDLFGYLSFAIKFGATDGIEEYFDAVNSSVEKSSLHDDAVFTYFAYSHGLTICGTNLSTIPERGRRTKMDNLSALRNCMELPDGKPRYEVEDKIKTFSEQNYSFTRQVKQIDEVDCFNAFNYVTNIKLESDLELQDCKFSLIYYDETTFLLAICNKTPITELKIKFVTEKGSTLLCLNAESFLNYTIPISTNLPLEYDDSIENKFVELKFVPKQIEQTEQTANQVNSEFQSTPSTPQDSNSQTVRRRLIQTHLTSRRGKLC